MIYDCVIFVLCNLHTHTILLQTTPNIFALGTNTCIFYLFLYLFSFRFFFHKHLCCVYNNVIKWAYLTAWHLYISNRQSERLSKRANTKGCFSIVHMYHIYWYLDHHSFFLAASIYQYKVFFFFEDELSLNVCVCVSCYSSTCLNLWVKLRCVLYDWERENDL